DVAFWRIAMRPGRPMAVGRISCPHAPPLRGSLPPAGAEPALGRPGDGLGGAGRSSVLFGLPGNPVAVMVTFLAFVRPALQRMMGGQASPPILLQAHSGEALRKKAGRTEYQRGIVSRDAQGRLSVRTTGNQGSGVLNSMVQANGLIVLHHDQGHVAVGDLVDVMMFDGAI
ncbi:molybdopterin-binding protein, partial [Hydrogenophaga sp.]|uniref:molybdopterin-binding protein n=1 Tax=Hydrogenophaga sp. TaxID=1904254 RepID=UPI003567C890